MSTDWFAPVTLTGHGLTLSPLTTADAVDFAEAARDRGEEVFEHLRHHPPQSARDAATIIAALNAPADQLPFAQRLSASGEFAGSSSFYEIDPTLRALAIGHTWVARKFWRSWVNTASKLTMLSRAFDDLGAERVVWHTDIRNTRSQAAIGRLGAQREGVLRHHRIRRDGSWRDTVQFSMLRSEWPAARDRLAESLTRHDDADPTGPTSPEREA